MKSIIVIRLWKVFNREPFVICCGWICATRWKFFRWARFANCQQSNNVDYSIRWELLFRCTHNWTTVARQFRWRPFDLWVEVATWDSTKTNFVLFTGSRKPCNSNRLKITITFCKLYVASQSRAAEIDDFFARENGLSWKKLKLKDVGHVSLNCLVGCQSFTLTVFHLCIFVWVLLRGSLICLRQLISVYF